LPNRLRKHQWADRSKGQKNWGKGIRRRMHKGGEKEGEGTNMDETGPATGSASREKNDNRPPQ